MIALGIYNFQRLPIDALPDITNVQVQINTEAPGYSPVEVEQRVTYYVETAMFGLPQLKETWSISRYGLSQVTVIFEEGTDIYFARQLVNQRLREAGTQLPPKLEPIMGPIATGLGEIYMWALGLEERVSEGSESLRGRRSIENPAGMDHPSATDDYPRCRGGQQHRRLYETIPRHSRS